MNATSTDWSRALIKYSRVAARLQRYAQAARDSRMRLARELLCRAHVGPDGFLEAHNWGQDIPGERGYLCQRALRLANDWTPIELSNILTSRAWNKYMVPEGAFRSEVRSYSNDPAKRKDLIT